MCSSTTELIVILKMSEVERLISYICRILVSIFNWQKLKSVDFENGEPKMDIISACTHKVKSGGRYGIFKMRNGGTKYSFETAALG